MSDRGGSSINYPVVWKHTSIKIYRSTKLGGGGGGGGGGGENGKPP